MISDQDIQAFWAAQPAATPKKKGNFLTSLIPSGGGIAGAAGGAALGTAILPGVGTLAGALLGGAVGGGAGKVAENAVEHNKLSSGVAGEAALNGVLGAGPLRLGKFGIDAVRGGVAAARAGGGLADALTTAGTKAANMSLTKTVGDKLAKSGEGLIAKEFRLNPTQQDDFKKLYGEEAVSALRRFGVKRPEDIAAKIQPLQESFDTVVKNIPAISQKQLSAGLKAVYEPLLKSPNILVERPLGQQIKAQADELIKLAEKGSIPADRVNQLRQSFDAAVRYTQKGSPEFNAVKETADALRKTLQEAANQSGIKIGSQSFKEIGSELNKLHWLDDVIGKQSYLGTGSLPANLTGLLGTLAGGTAGGPAGLAAGAALTTAVNSNAGRRAIANTTLKAGEKLTAKGANANPYGLKALTGRIAPVGLANALAGQSLSDGQSTQPNTSMTNANINQTMMPELSQTDANMSTSSSPFAPQNLESAIQQILSNGGTLDDVSKFVTIAGAVQKAQTTANPAGYSKPSASQYAQGVSGEQSIQQLRQLLQQDPSLISKSTIPGQGLGVLGSLESGLLGTSDYKAITHNILNSIARINTGANMPAEEEAFYRKTYLPQPGDSEQTKQDKIAALESFFAPITNYGGGNGQSAPTDLASAILAGQGAL